MQANNWWAKAILPLLIPFSMLTNGCVKIPPHNFQAPPPAIVPEPPVLSSATILFEGISSDPIGTALVQALPRTIDAKHFPGGCDNPCYHFTLQTFDAVLSDGNLVMSPSYKGNVQAKENLGECDLDPVIVDVVISGRPTIGQNGTQMFISLSGVSVQPTVGSGSDTHCVIGGLLDASGTIQDNLNKIAGSMKSQIEALEFPIPVADLATKLTGPIAIPSKPGPTFCVYPRISDLEVGTIEAFQPPVVTPGPIRTSLPKSLAIPLSFVGGPSVVAQTSSSCPAPNPPGTILVGNHDPRPFQLLVRTAANYGTLSDAATGTLKPTTGHWGPLKLTVKPTRLQLANANGQILGGLTLKGALSGTVFFFGIPTVSPDGETVSISNLTLAATSQEVLGKINPRLPDFVANVFQKPIQDAFTFNLEKLLPPAGATQPITFPLGNNGIIDLGSLNVTVDFVRSLEGQLQADVVIKGGNAIAHDP